MPDKISIDAIVNRQRGDVWRLFNEPQHITQWNFASDDWCCPRAENDLRVGGRLRSRMEAKDGSSGFDFEAIYDEVVAENKLAYTMPDGRHVETRFEDLDGATKVTTEFDPESSNPLDMQRDGWQAILNNFKNYAESA
ncbi:MAG: SRPBCC family protein [Chloroflexota bacterium]|nr:SRPBCC family protein [Chloroflexota bacterium]MDE2948334.1 SRPBCC family protein [Chloroflexota bacterium]